MISIPPIGIIASIAEYRGFDDNIKILDPHHEISLAKTISVPDIGITMHSCRLKHRKTLTQIFSQNNLIFEAIDYRVLKNEPMPQRDIDRFLLDTFLTIDTSKLLRSHPAPVHFAMVEAIQKLNGNTHQPWQTVIDMKSEIGQGDEKLSFIIGLSLFDDVFIEVNCKSSLIFFGETLFDSSQPKIDEHHLKRIHQIHKSLSR